MSISFFLKQKYASLAFGNIVALTVDFVNIRATCASALPTRSRSSRGPLMSYKNKLKYFGCYIWCYGLSPSCIAISADSLKQA